MSSDLHRASLFFRYSREEYSHHKDVFERGKIEMLSALKHVRVDPNSPQKAASNEHEPKARNEDPVTDIGEELKDAAASDADLRKLYRRIVHETHPDKIAISGLGQKEIDRRMGFYKLATEAANKQNEDILVEVALDLEIDTGLDEARIANSLRNRSQFFTKEINQIKDSVEWFWVHATEEAKTKIIKEICNRNGWLYVTDEDIIKCVRFATGVHPGSREDIQRRARDSNQKRKKLS
jgi:hypothetical protein